jgi:hypothetical protein
MTTIETRTADEFRSFITIAVRGECAIYHRGYLARDKSKDAGVLALANAAKHASSQGVATLTQRRLGDHDYEYLATRC